MLMASRFSCDSVVDLNEGECASTLILSDLPFARVDIQPLTGGEQ
jgi:hypothetical protein